MKAGLRAQAASASMQAGSHTAATRERFHTLALPKSDAAGGQGRHTPAAELTGSTRRRGPLNQKQSP
jgi:hypothetical protein